MMSEASFASLGPTLLARKGGAKPAMRPQLTPLPDNMAEIAALADEQLEDLGWNDMGSEESEGELVISTTPAPSPSAREIDDTTVDTTVNGHAIIDPLSGSEVVSLIQHPSASEPANEDTLEATDPVVRRHQERLAQSILSGAAAETDKEERAAKLLRPKVRSLKSAAKKKAVKSRATTKVARRAAFTLRLDPDRHLRLRLAATMQGVSAQSLVTDALDAMLVDIKDLDALVERMTRD